MLFTSWSFIIFFAVLLAVYYLVPGRLQWLLLLAADAAFYACAGWQGLVFMAAAVVISWGGTNLMARSFAEQRGFLQNDGSELGREEKKAYRGKMERGQRTILIFTLLALLGILAALKYTNFAVSNINGIFGASLAGVDWVLPMGLSFYTFQTVGYVVDVAWEKVEAEKNILRCALFTSFFPLLIQGPICRFGELTETLFKPHRPDGAQIRMGLERVIWGYFKKLVIADRLLVAVTAICGSPDKYTGAYVVFGALFYAAELYADFTGGIDITIGIAQTLGVRVPENFIRPYFSKNIAEYWRRWHISMGTWFRDYVFYPLSVSRAMLKLTRKLKNGGHPQLARKASVYISTIVTWFLTGLWHGAAWNFVVWGLLNAVFILAAEEFKPLSRRFRERFARLSCSGGYAAFEMLRTFLLMCALRTLDCYRNVPLTFAMLGTVFTGTGLGTALAGLTGLGLTAADFAVALIGVAAMFGVSLFQEKRGPVRGALENGSVWLRGALFTLLVLMILVFGSYGVGYDSTQFIYNQF